MKQFKRMIALVVSVMLVISITAASVPTVSAAVYSSSSPIPSFSSIEVIDGGIHFKWEPYTNSNCPDGVFYRVYYMNANGGWTRMTTTAATQYVDADVHIGSSFRYTIRCVTPDGNGVVDLMDATTLQYHLSNLYLPVEEAVLMLGDVDGNKALESVDATYIQRKNTGIDVPYAIGTVK